MGLVVVFMVATEVVGLEWGSGLDSSSCLMRGLVNSR